MMKAPNSGQHEWIIDGGNINICWNTIPCVPDFLLKNIFCSCQKTDCVSSKYACKANSVSCSELCSCLQCENSNDQNECCDDFYMD